ncbi:glycoside hydrolase family 172 protein [Aquisphaera insulae]|uniref:glycoside hydrolase family 172 protein n=1 Tax=Aquisphaera insulae TaxID=2712864 RepID=UPI0013EE2515|nr:glycoside hydrolase family 172 protein [Aquisphaera insulae]
MNLTVIRNLVAILVAGLCCPLPTPAWGQSVADLDRITDGTSHSHVKYHRTAIPRGKEIVLADLEGPGKVTYWYITDDSGGKIDPGLVLKVYWDDAPEPSIHVPLADFFGAVGGRTIDYQSAPIQIQHLAYMCHFPMPFARRARFVLANDGNADYDRGVAFGFDWESDPKYAAEKGRLHVAWRRSNPVRNDAPSLESVVDADRVGGKNTFNSRHTILDVKGHGHYVGNILQVHSLSPRWWGEGVTFFHRDGRTEVHSPGTEDEYGSCWEFGKTFAYPYCGLLLDEGGDHRMYRWYVTNPVRFRESLKVEIQSIHVPGNAPFRPGADDFTSVAFWYQEAPLTAVSLQPFAERTAPSRAVDYEPRKVGTAATDVQP